MASQEGDAGPSGLECGWNSPGERELYMIIMAVELAYKRAAYTAAALQNLQVQRTLETLEPRGAGSGRTEAEDEYSRRVCSYLEAVQEQQTLVHEDAERIQKLMRPGSSESSSSSDGEEAAASDRPSGGTSGGDLMAELGRQYQYLEELLRDHVAAVTGVMLADPLGRGGARQHSHRAAAVARQLDEFKVAMSRRTCSLRFLLRNALDQHSPSAYVPMSDILENIVRGMVGRDETDSDDDE